LRQAGGIGGAALHHVQDHLALALFDAETVDETATYEKPIAPARGIEAVIVNGALVWRDGRPTGARPGMALRRERE